MIRLQLEHYVTLGGNLANLRQYLDSPTSHAPYVLKGGQPVQLDVPGAVVSVLGQLKDACDLLGLTTSSATIHRTVLAGRVQPSHVAVLIEMVQSEMANQLFLHVPAERAKFWQRTDLVSDRVSAVFPIAATEIRESGTAFACGLWSASVFHSMRAAESALVAIVDELGITRSGSEMWGNYIDLVESYVGGLGKKPKADPEKAAKLARLSRKVGGEAAAR